MHYAGVREGVLHVSYMRGIRMSAGMVEVLSVVIKSVGFLCDWGCFCDTWLYTGEPAETVKSGIDFALG